MILHVFALGFVFLLLISILGNGCVIYIFLKRKEMRSTSNMFIVNLAISDLIMMLTHGLPVGINIFYQRYWMWGVLNCKLFAMLGGVCGTVSIFTMIMIGYDRYNVIVKGLSAKKITKMKAFLMISTVWIYAILSTSGPFLGWGAYSLEGFLITCSYDYIKEDWNAKSFVLYTLITHFFLPLIGVVFYYSQIAKAVISHERAMKEQAKKMNVESLRQKSDSSENMEVKIAKVSITNVLLWIATWSPYAIVVMIGLSGSYDTLTPIFAGLPSLLLKTNSSLNPVVFAVAHPKYREAIAKEFPCLGIGKVPPPARAGDPGTVVTATST
ncbi:compound eye opsin BCRH1 [Eurytemora carolleeae]|uniref:compound eye opsin BCRH1 n=1 Tax=Eurytemora carolleeae TaxID=1294199 RepID=UPI000C761C7C|nr:compound eye opsin BCRH1 [Eurytemora carolleeae]|eukprot:XP_023339009.1 compound eye opsin BCRH1-like [Eurytemora affinis]